MSAVNPNPMEKSMVSALIVENAGGGLPLPYWETGGERVTRAGRVIARRLKAENGERGDQAGKT
jgi:hypothetical protein